MESQIAEECVRIYPSIVRELGSANDALVFGRIVQSAALVDGHGYIHHGFAWRRASARTLAEETGLTEAQVKHSIERLLSRLWLVAEEHRHGGVSDRTRSFRSTGPSVRR